MISHQRKQQIEVVASRAQYSDTISEVVLIFHLTHSVSNPCLSPSVGQLLIPMVCTWSWQLSGSLSASD